MDFSLEFTPDLIAIFLTLFVLEIVLGVDNVIFISILASKLPEEQQAKARTLGLTLAMGMRVLLVLLAGWIITLDEDLFEVFGMGFSGRELVLIAGGGFLLYKAVHEIHLKLEGEEEHGASAVRATFGAVLAQILLMDLVFSLDSVITAVGMTSNMVVIIAAVVISFGILLFAAKYIFEFVNRHPTVKMLALSFLLLIGVFLVAEGFGIHIEKALIYGPMAFAVLVEVLNLAYARNRAKRKGKQQAEPVKLHDTMHETKRPVAAGQAAPAAGADVAAPEVPGADQPPRPGDTP
ncbi:TerC family protein [Agrococcus terreus]|uniref:Integral membrane protein TerC n=1 Tax=Agrococcus terreus TaxID=574649 RepID=A0ABQ2KBT3_9MICO|nr:TerC family protein [Agrococcus terreus]GGN78331.1 integral membrane protein TerC [Agrococcus terreus]